MTRRYLFARVALMGLSLLGLLVFQFALFRLLPGDPTTGVLSDSMTREVRAALSQMWGLDQPLSRQFLAYARNLLRLEFGVSFFHNAPVWEILRDRLWNTLALMLPSVCAGNALGVAFGAFAATRRSGRLDGLLLVTAVVARATPVFVSGILALLVFASALGWVPQGGMHAVGVGGAGAWGRFLRWDFYHHLLLPTGVCALFYFATPFLVMRTAMRKELGAEYVTVARAKGLSRSAVVWRHAARNALNPVITTCALSFGFAVGGQVMVETVFRWPGMGSELIASTLRRDYPVMQSAYFLISLVVILANLVADLLYTLLDPRIRYERVR
jgi:peptide/nickel transport system permease protein